ncbi:MAG: hypothetical protein IJD16_06195 [Desulfovibrio sp.]|nr:hypothetical protein [Desulfovibrio sp.]
MLAGCTVRPHEVLVQSAHDAGFEQRYFITPVFTLFGLYRPALNGQAKVLRVYIEGDGRAWLSRSRASLDPTPHNPVALRLALADPASTDAVLYLARPCQYVQREQRRNCAVRYWTDARLSFEVIAALNHAVDEARAEARAQQVALTGFSGGGGAAVLMAAQRQDVIFLGSVAGNLDTDAWTDLLGVSPLHASCNPIDSAASLAHIPQRHYSSRHDTVMPPAVSAGFCQRSGQPRNCRAVDGVEHNGAWQEVWDYTYP